MAKKKETLPQLTESKILVYAINHLQDKIDDLEVKFASKDASDPLVATLKEEMTKPLLADKELCIKRWELETGVEWTGR